MTTRWKIECCIIGVYDTYATAKPKFCPICGKALSDTDVEELWL